jgi:hypothetical protein
LPSTTITTIITITIAAIITTTITITTIIIITIIITITTRRSGAVRRIERWPGVAEEGPASAALD